MKIRRGTDLIDLPVPMTSEARLSTYHQHLESKINIQAAEGLHVELDEIHPALQVDPFRHQAAIVQWALRGGSRLIAAAFGTGKTMCSLEILRQIHLHTGGRTLIICPLGVKHQFQSVDGPRLGMTLEYVTDDADIEAAETPYLITNYERVRDGSISPMVIGTITAVSLDEASVLADYGSKTFNVFCELFADTQYKFAATATPARNKYKELLNFAHWLGVADSGQALTRYFKRNSQKANELTLMASMEKEFWMWVSSWALFLDKPSDLGFPDDGYVMPNLNVEWVRIASDHKAAWKETDGWGQRFLFASASNGVTQAAREKRRSMDDRITTALEIIESGQPDDHWLIWHHLEDERKALKKLLPDAVDVFGSQSIEEKEKRILGFSDGEFKCLITKPSIAGSGCNFQHHCNNMIFVGTDYQFERLIQSVHRLYRFQQSKPVNVYIVHTDAEDGIVASLKKKWQQHSELVANTTAIIQKYGLATEAMKAEMRRSMGVNRQVVEGNLFTAINNDAIEEVATMAENSVDLICTSIPFGNQYEYTETLNDLGYNDDNNAFWDQMDYLIPELLRVLKPGRIAAIHVKDRIRFGNVTGHGVPVIDPFSDDCSYAFRRHGFLQLCRITCVNDVVRENNQTYRLTYGECVKDGTKMGSGTPEYWLIFRKPQTDKSKAYADEPVSHSREEFPLHHWQIYASEFWRSSGDRLLKPEEIPQPLDPEELAHMDAGQIYRWYRSYSRSHTYNLQDHLALGEELADKNRLPKTFMLFNPDSPDGYKDTVWSVHDYSRMRVLNAQQQQRRQEAHVCPLPLDLIERIIERFSNKGELVFDPFAGIFSTPYMAIKMGRKGLGTELNAQYFDAGVRYCQEAEVQQSTPTLFNFLELEQELQPA